MTIEEMVAFVRLLNQKDVELTVGVYGVGMMHLMPEEVHDFLNHYEAWHASKLGFSLQEYQEWRLAEETHRQWHGFQCDGVTTKGARCRNTVYFSSHNWGGPWGCLDDARALLEASREEHFCGVHGHGVKYKGTP